MGFKNGGKMILSISAAAQALFKALESAFNARNTAITEQPTTDAIKTKKDLKKACDVVPDIFLTSVKIFKLYQNSLNIYEKYFEPKYLDKRLLRSVQKALRANNKELLNLQKKFEKSYKEFEKND